MNGISFIIPYANTLDGSEFERITNIQIIIERFLLLQKNIEFEIIIAEQDLGNIILPLKDYGPNVYHYLFRKGNVFNKSWLLNSAVKDLAKYDTIIFSESDTYIHNSKNYLANLYSDFKSKKLKWQFGWNRMVWTTEEVKKNFILNGIINIDQCKIYPLGIHIGSGAEGGIFCVDKKFFYNIGAFNEEMDGLGGIDNYLCLKCRTITNSYPIFKQDMIHLYHPLSSMKDRKLRKRNSDIYKEAKRDPMIAIRRDVGRL